MNVNIREVARRAGVSAMTVSRVLNGGAVRADTRRRVEAAIAELDYVRNSVARGLFSRRTGALGLIVPDLLNPFFAQVVRGAESVARRAGYRLLLGNSEGDLGLERGYVADMVGHRVEGLLVAPVSDRSRSVLRPLARRSFPFVLVDRAVPGLEADLVEANGAEGARQLVEHLLCLGHRRIAMILGPVDVSTTRQRRQGYLDALGRSGADFDPGLLLETTVDRAGGQRAMQRALALDPRPSAVFAVNNMTALGAMQAIREAGLAVPDDVALVCFDDVEHLAVLSPFLTVVDQPAETFGTLAAELLLERIGRPDARRPRHVVLQPELIIRRSCGSATG